MGKYAVKPGAVLEPRTPALDALLDAVQAACDEFGIVITITCGRDSHSPTDPHTLGRAIDIRTNDLPVGFLPVLYGFLLGRLGPLFYLQYETPPASGERTDLLRYVLVVPSATATAAHLHAQVKRGAVYPPALATPSTTVA